MQGETHHDPRRPVRQDTFDLRDQHQQQPASDDTSAAVEMHYHADVANHIAQQQQHYISDEEEHSVMEDDSDDERHAAAAAATGEGEVEGEEDYIEDDDSSSLSIPNESIDFDLVYSLHSFAATVEGQANVVKGDSLFLMDDTNSYWWLVRVLKTQEVGYIPAENIETPFERLARLNKHRNVDLATPTMVDRTEDTPSARHRKGVNFTPQLHVHRYPPAVWDEEEIEEEDVEWDDAEYSDEDPQLAEELAADGKLPDDYSRARQQQQQQAGPGPMDMEPDDGMQWDKGAAEANQQAQIQALQAQQQQQQQQQQAQQEEMARRQQQQQQQEEMEQREQLARQQQQQAAISQQRAQQQEQQQQQQLRTATSRERLNATPDRDPAARSQSPFDPLQATETRKLTVTPTIARDDEERKRVRDEEMVATAAAEEAARKKAKGPGSAPASVSGGKGQMGPPVSSASIINVRPAGQPGGLAASGAKLRKERDGTSSISSVASTSEDEGGGKKKKSSFIGGLFSRNKSKKNPGTTGSIGSLESAEAVMNMRPSDDGNGRLSSAGSANGHGGGPDPGLLSPTTQTAMSQQQASIIARSGTSLSMDQQRPSQDQSGSAGRGTPEVSQHASQLRQHDQQQQALYLNKYLNRSPASPPNAGAIGPGGEDLSWGLQTAQAVAASRERGYGSHMAASSPSKTPGISTTTSSSSNMLDVPSPISIAPSASYNSFNGNSGGKPRPGSLVISPGAPDLSVIRVFAGQNLQTEATFKTVLLNSSTTSSDLIRQAIQRFRLLGASAVVDHADEYYLTAVKQVEGSSAVLRPDERPLYVFESLVEEARMEMEVPKVKRSSVGSISSVSSNLSMHPAIKKLPMNDFTDDSAVKFYLNRRGEEGGEGHVDREDIIAGMESARHASEDGDEVDVTLIADSSMVTSEGGELSPRSQQQSFLGVGSERFSSPSFRFSMQLVIYAEDLPDDMVFDPLTEAIVFKHTLRDRERGGSTSLTSSTSGPTGGFRRKVFVFPKNVTVAEVIELGLERFGIQEGVVDGGDEVEDKMNKRKSGGSRVRYGLFVKVTPASEDRELLPASRLIEAFPRLPTFRRTDTSSNKRRSTDSAMLLLGSMDDVASDDPTFILRRAISYRNSTSRHRTSAPLDEIALSKLHRFSQSSSASASFSERSEMTASPTRDDGISSLNRTAFGKIKVMQQQQAPPAGQQQSQQKSRQEIIAAQRAATRANQQSLLSAQVNSVRGVDVLLPGNAMLRSARHDSADKMRYSYVEPDGETYDISDIVEEEWRGNNPIDGPGGRAGRAGGTGGDLLEGVVSGQGGGASLERVLSRVGKNGKIPAQQTQQQQGQEPELYRIESTERSVSPSSEYSNDDIVGAADRYALGAAALGTGTAAGTGGRTVSSAPSAAYQQQQQQGQPRAAPAPTVSSRATSPYSYKTARTASPSAISDIASNHGGGSRPGTTTPTAGLAGQGPTQTTRSIGSVLGRSGRNPSVASGMSDMSGYATPATHITATSPSPEEDDSPIQGRNHLAGMQQHQHASSSPVPSTGSGRGTGSPAGGKATSPSPSTPRRDTPSATGTGAKRAASAGASKKVYIPKDDFGIQHMMSIIEYKAKAMKKQQYNDNLSNTTKSRSDATSSPGMGQTGIELTKPKLPPLHPVDEMLFGQPLDVEALHPQIRDVYKDSAKYLADTDKELDTWLKQYLVKI